VALDQVDPPLRGLPVMTPIAAYYVMIVTDHENARRTRRYESIVPRRSLVERIVDALETLVRLGRSTSAQPI
jgi:hypothetical protein